MTSSDRADATALADRSSDPGRVPAEQLSTRESRALSKSLFIRLRSLEEGSAEYSYVRNTLVESNLALVWFAAGRFQSRSEPMEDIVQVGTVGLIKSINRFDPEREVEFPTFALPTITGEIKRFFRDTSWAVRVPRRLQELRLSLAKASDELEQGLDRQPTAAELSERLGISEAEVVEGQSAANAYTAGSLDAAADSESAEGPLSRRLGYEDRRFEGVDNLESLKPLVAELPERDRTILSLRFVGDLTQSEIGAELGISQMHVSRLLNHALATLRTGLMADS